MEPESLGQDPADEMLKLARKEDRRQARQTLINRIALFIVVAATLYAAVVSQIAANKSNENSQDIKDAQGIRDRESSCTSQILFSAIGALNDRSQFTVDQATANISLQKAQAALLLPSIRGHVSTPAEGQEALKRYFQALTECLSAATKSQTAAINSPYPTPQQYAACLKTAHDPNGADPTIGPNPKPTPSTP